MLQSKQRIVCKLEPMGEIGLFLLYYGRLMLNSDVSRHARFENWRNVHRGLRERLTVLLTSSTPKPMNWSRDPPDPISCINIRDETAVWPGDRIPEDYGSLTSRVCDRSEERVCLCGFCEARDSGRGHRCRHCRVGLYRVHHGMDGPDLVGTHPARPRPTTRRDFLSKTRVFRERQPGGAHPPEHRNRLYRVFLEWALCAVFVLARPIPEILIHPSLTI